MYGSLTHLPERTAVAVSIKLKNLLKKETFVPNNNAELIIPLDDDLEIKMIGTFRSIKLSKQQAYYFKPRGRGMDIYGNASYLQINIHPGYSKYIIKNLEEYTNGIYEVPSILGRTIDKLIKIFVNKDDYELNEVMEETFLLDEIDPNPVLMEAIDMISGSCGSTTIKNIYTYLDVSKSTLEQRFNKDIGLTPKEYCKIEKLNCFIKTYQGSNGASLTELTYQCGYYDQSHLIKDFRYFLDMSPKEFFANT